MNTETPHTRPSPAGLSGTTMKPVSALSDAVCQSLIGVLTDIDDTITTEGNLPAASYAMLERLTAAGILVIPITGRPGGWCDMIARLWPVAGVVGENGALALRYDHESRKMRRHFMMDEETRIANREKLNALSQTILKAVPGSALASDQNYRDADLAIDFCEDVPPLAQGEVDRIVEHFAAEGATAKVSSIHVNGWFGAWDKLSMSKVFLAAEFGIDLDAEKERFIYCGDSPNDAPMFSFFPNSCGVANVRDFVGRIEALPTYVARARGGQGFVEIGERILAAHSAKHETSTLRS